MIRVLYTTPNLDTAGSGRAMVDLIAELVRQRRVAPAVAVDRVAGTELERRLEELGVPLHEVPVRVAARPRLSLPARARRRGRELASLGADVWHSFHYLDDYTEPLVAHAAGAAWVYTKKNMSWNRRSWRLRTRFADAVLAQNTAMLDRFFSSPRTRRKVHLVPRGVVLDAWRAAPTTTLTREQLGVPDDAVVITCVAHLQRRKRQEVLVEALAGVPDAHLVLAGTELDGHGAVADRAAEVHGVVDRVHRPGPVRDVAGLLAVSDIFCLPTGREAEGSPVALLEAMAAGLPVVVTDVPGSADIVRPDVDGVVVRPDDPGALAAALRGLAEDPAARDRLGAAALARVRAEHTIAIEAERTARVYDTVLAGRR